MDNASVDTNVRMPFRKQLGFGIGDFGNNFCWTFVATYLMFFYTDVFLIPLGAVSGLMLVARAWDAVNDPLIGGLADRTRTRWGRYRPWVLFMSFPTSLVLILTFWAHPEWSDRSKIIYMYITYCVLVFCYTGVNIPYSAMTSVLTQNTDERSKLSTMRITLANIAIGGIGVIVLPLVAFFGGGDQVRGFTITAIVFVCVFIACQAIVFASCREVVPPPKEHKYPLKTQLKSVFSNKPFIIALCGQFLWGFYLHGRGSMYVYYFKYVCGNENLLSLYNLVGIAPLVAGCYLFDAWYKINGNKGRVTAYACFLSGSAMILMHFTNPITSPASFYILCAASQFFLGILASGIYGVIPDTVEFGELRTGVRNDGFLSAFISLGNKFGIALGTAGVGALLAFLGFQANVEQTPVVTSAIDHLFTTVPGVGSFVCAVIFLFYHVDRKEFHSILEQLHARARK